MMSRNFAKVWSIALALGLCPLACDEEDDGSGDDANDSGMTSDAEGDDGETEADDFGDETGGETSTTSTSSTSSTSTTSTTSEGDGDSGSAACESFFDCPTVVCECPDGSTVETASCLEGVCATAETCADPPYNACE